MSSAQPSVGTGNPKDCLFLVKCLMSSCKAKESSNILVESSVTQYRVREGSGSCLFLNSWHWNKRAKQNRWHDLNSVECHVNDWIKIAIEKFVLSQTSGGENLTKQAFWIPRISCILGRDNRADCVSFECSQDRSDVLGQLSPPIGDCQINNSRIN